MTHLSEAWTITYRGWTMEHLPRRTGLVDTWLATAPDFRDFLDIDGTFITAPDRMALIAEIDRYLGESQ